LEFIKSSSGESIENYFKDKYRSIEIEYAIEERTSWYRKSC